MDYQADMDIDEGQLDVEWLDHPSRMARYCVLAAETQRDMDLAKERVEVVKAEVEKAVRADPDAYGVEVRISAGGVRQPPTERAIEVAVLTDETYQEAVKEHISAKFDYSVAQGVVRAFDARKSALENLVRLHGQQYFAGPSVPRDLTRERQQRDKMAQSRIRLNRRS